MNRRDALLAIGGLAGLTLGFWPRRTEARLRPPGARPPREFDAKCIRCFRCAEVCPPKAILFDSVLDPRASDTPFIEAHSRACVLCMKCTEVCPTGALEPVTTDLAKAQSIVRMGRPVLDRTRCLPWNGRGICRLCYYACPYPDSAVKLAGPRQGPVFVADACVGCGLCEEACPSHARAIRIVPTGART